MTYRSITDPSLALSILEGLDGSGVGRRSSLGGEGHGEREDSRELHFESW